MKLSKLLYFFFAFLPLTANAIPIINLMPPAPTMANLTDGNACSSYAQQMQNYLKSSDDYTDIMNSLWFSTFGRTDPSPLYKQECTNGVCTNYYGVNESMHGTDPGCFIASTSSQTAKQALFNYLIQAYQAAVTHNYCNNVIRANSFGLYGSAASCIANNNYTGCQLYK